MKEIAFTTDTREMVAIAKEIVRENSKKYNAGIMDMIYKAVRDRRPEATEPEVEELVYVTIYQYWYYGVSFDEFFYYDFSHKTHEEKLEYMTYRQRLRYSDYLNQKDKVHILVNKYETYQLFQEYYKRDVIVCRTEDDYPLFLEFIQKHPEFVVKPIDMSGGRGVHKADVIGMNEKEIRTFFSELFEEMNQNRIKYLRGMESAVIIEELIDQDERMAAFNPASINGVRLPTVLNGEEVLVYQPWLKIGRNGQFLTSAVFGTMDAGIDEKTGIVDTAGYTETGEVWYRHPDNNIQIVGFQIPQWDELIALAKECARRVPFFRFVGWDFALSKNGWCVMEANYSCDFMWQLYRERGMRKEFEELIGWRLDKRFWWE